MKSIESRQVFACAVFGLIALVIPATVVGQKRLDIPRNAVFSCDGAFVGTCGVRVRVFESKTGKLLREIDVPSTQHIAFSPVVAELFATSGVDGVLRLWRVGKKDFVRELRGHDGIIASVAFEATGRYVASASVRYRGGKSDLGQLRLWEIETGKMVKSHEVMEGGIQGVSFSGDGKLVAFCRKQRNDECHVEVYHVEPWKLATSILLRAPEELETTRFGKALPFGVATCFEPDQNHLLVAGGICVRIDPGRYKYACTPTGLLWRADLTEPSSAKLLGEPRREYYKSLGIAPDGKTFVSVNGNRVLKEAKPLIQMRDVSTGKLIWSVESDTNYFGATMSPDGKLVAACQKDGVHLLDAKTGEPVRLIAVEK